MKKNRYKILIGIILLICLIAIVSVILIMSLNKKEEFESHAIYLGRYDYSEKKIENENYVITSYEDYSKLFSSDELKSDDFKNNNYAIVEISYDSCSEENVKIDDYNINNNVLKVNVSYTAKCGVCAPEYLYYLIPIDKNINNITIDLDYKSTNIPNCPRDVAYKPIIYLYPTKDTIVTVKLVNSENLIFTYPKYKSYWKVLASSNGTLFDEETNRSYYGLYWEGINHKSSIKNDGFVVKGEDTVKFLEEKLALLGLNEREANEFIVYWLPKLEVNKYNYIRFETLEEINEYMPLIIDPVPTSIIRVMMDYKPLEEKIDVKEQQLITPKREGFVVVEWGGSIIE